MYQHHQLYTSCMCQLINYCLNHVPNMYLNQKPSSISSSKYDLITYTSNTIPQVCTSNHVLEPHCYTTSICTNNFSNIPQPKSFFSSCSILLPRIHCHDFSAALFLLLRFFYHTFLATLFLLQFFYPTFSVALFLPHFFCCNFSLSIIRAQITFHKNRYSMIFKCDLNERPFPLIYTFM
jgi:hypothetical protein